MLKWIAVAALAALVPAVVTAQGVTPTTIVVGQSAAHDRAGVRARHRNARRRARATSTSSTRAAASTAAASSCARWTTATSPIALVANTRRFIETDQAFALFGYVGTPTTIAAMPMFTKAQVPLIGPFTGAEAFRRPFNRYIFNVRASYYAETDKLVDLLATLRHAADRGVLPERRVRQGRPRGRRARVPRSATCRSRRPRRSSATSTDVKAAVEAIVEGRPAGRRDDQRVQVLRRVHQGDEGRRHRMRSS